MHGATGYAEVGDEPESSWCECGGDSGDEGFEFRLGEAVEEEVSDDEIIGAFERNGECVGVKGAESGGGAGSCGFAAAVEQLEHGGAGVDCVCLEVRVVF